MTKSFMVTEQVELCPACIYVVRLNGSTWLAKTNNTASSFGKSYEVTQHPAWNFNDKLKCLGKSIFEFSQKNGLPYDEPELFYRSTYWDFEGGDAFSLKAKDLNSRETGEIYSISEYYKKYIVFYGNLFCDYSEGEIFIIFAHEIGHCTEDLWESSPLFCLSQHKTKEHRADYFAGFFCRMAGLKITQANIDNLFYRNTEQSEHPSSQMRKKTFEEGQDRYDLEYAAHRSFDSSGL